MTNLLQDPLVLIYDKLFFGLTLGNFDLHVSTDSGLLEEFLIIREEYFSKLGLLEKIREICDHPSILQIVDEVQSSFERTEKFYTFEHYSLTPNIEIMAKGLTSWLPMSATAAPGSSLIEVHL